MLIINMFSRVATNPYISTRYNGVTYHIRSVKWEWHHLKITNKEWNNNSVTLNQMNKNTDHK